MSNLFDLKGKVALITGGNRGIGLGMADALAAAGADLMIWGSSAANNDAAVEKLRPRGVRVRSAVVDVSNEEAVNEAFAGAVKELGRVDAVFANAGIGGPAMRFLESTGKDFDRILGVNTSGAYYTVREACRHMVARAQAGDPGGSLVLMGTVGTESGMARFQTYAASKGALAPLMRAIIMEHSRHGIRVNLIQPGYIDTEMTDHFREAENVNAAIVQAIPMRRWGKPADFGGMAVYLASDASTYHSGNTIVIDGGYLAS